MQQSLSIGLTPLRIAPPKRKMIDVVKINVNRPSKDYLREHLRRTAKPGNR